jgi:hypothetical protein
MTTTTKIGFVRNGWKTLLLLSTLVAVANAQATRTWVSGVGDDANPCSRTAPCKTFAGAISKTSAGGEIDALDPGGFGAVTITKAITIDGGDNLAGVLVAGTNGINVVAGPSDVVTLRRLQFNGIGSGLDGIQFTTGAALHVEQCNIFGFLNFGIQIQLAAFGKVTVKDTVISEAAMGGISVQTSSSVVQLDVINTHISNTPAAGLSALGSALVAIRDSDITLNATGISLTGTGNVVTVTGSTLSFNNIALQSVAGGTILASGNTFSLNNTVYSLNGGTILTGADNAGLNSMVGGTSGTSPKI